MLGRTVIENSHRFREKMRTGCCFGADITLNDPQITDLLCTCGFDFFWIDCEHSAMSIETLGLHLTICNARGVLSMVRVPWNDPIRIKPVLDMGANGIIVPNVKTAEEATLAVHSCLYPPKGIRGYGPRQCADWISDRIPPAEFGRDANQAIFKVIQIESAEGVANIDEIVKVQGLDSIALGPMDLSASMGLFGQMDHPRVVQAIRAVIEKTRDAGKIVGYPAVFGDDLAPVVDLVQNGVRWLSVGEDITFLRGAADRALQSVRKHLMP
jgi:2-keto-3-deoxy-L-rhamnonate aldolase RhmA